MAKLNARGNMELARVVKSTPLEQSVCVEVRALRSDGKMLGSTAIIRENGTVAYRSPWGVLSLLRGWAQGDAWAPGPRVGAWRTAMESCGWVSVPEGRLTPARPAAAAVEVESRAVSGAPPVIEPFTAGG